MSDDRNSDSNDSDIFIEKQIKPINKLTIQEALLIKFNVVNLKNVKQKSPLVKSPKNKKKKCERNDKINTQSPKTNGYNSTKARKGLKKAQGTLKNHHSDQKISIASKESSFEVNEGPTHSNIKETPVKNKNNFSPLKRTPEKKQCGEKSEINTENIRISPGIARKRKKFQLFKDVNPKVIKNTKYCRKIFVENPENVSEIEHTEVFESKPAEVLEDNFIDNKESSPRSSTKKILETEALQLKILNFNDQMENEIKDNSELLCFLLKKIICEETKKQLDLENKMFDKGEKIEKLLSGDECEILETFLNLKENACKVYVRMLCRKKDWHRISVINFKDINEDLEKEFKVLHEVKFVDINIEEQDIKTQLDLLSKPEIQILCKNFNVLTKLSTLKKNELINALLEDSKNQKSVLEMLSKKNQVSRINLLRTEIKKILGVCIKLNEKVLSVFNKILLLFSFAHYADEENKRFGNQLNMCAQVYKNFIRFPNYQLSPSVVFVTRNDFEKYEEAIYLRDCFYTAINLKNHDDFSHIGNIAMKKFLQLLDDSGYQERFKQLQPFLKKFSAGSIYAKMLTTYCQTFKKKSDTKEIVEVVKTLLGQDLFLISKRGKWYEMLSLALENLKDNNAAAEVLIKSQSDSSLDDVQKLTLQLRGQLLLRKKSNGITKSHLRELLDDLCTISVQEPPSIEIRGKALSGNEAGYKCVYVAESEDGKMYSSVEERAILYYKEMGFTKGYHTEGFIIQSIYFLLFYDIIYGLSPPGVFQSLYQKAPLDLYSKAFYLNRKEAIDTLLNDMYSWSEEEILTRIETVYYNNFNVSCVITWKEHFTPELFCDITKCITMPVLICIFQRFISNFRVARSGFPDLTLWNPETKKCKFVEVKSPNDKLSPNQRIWLDYLRSVGVDCEVCNVKSRRCNRPQNWSLRTAEKRRQNFCQLHLERWITEKHMILFMNNLNGFFLFRP